jgi:hypothetical protein
MRRIVLLVAVLGAAGCVSMTPEARAVRLTREKADVNGCKEIGGVNAYFALSFRASSERLQMAAAEAGADTVLVTSDPGDRSGTGYDCSHRDEKKDPPAEGPNGASGFREPAARR